MLPLFLSVIGLAIDAGIVFGARRELQNVADAAARAGAMQVDQQVYRASSGALIVLDQPAARQIAAEYASSQNADLSARVVVEPQRVVVSVSREVTTSFMRLAGISTVRVSATAPAELRYGIERANR
jgi:Flp pilus assembly protein TadG